MLFEALVNNDSLKVLDFSFNSIGVPSSITVPYLNKFFTSNKTLVHLDISMNYFSIEDTLKLSEGLNSNRTIYGLHFVN